MPDKEKLFDAVNTLNVEMDILFAVIKGAQKAFFSEVGSGETEVMEVALDTQFERVKARFEECLKFQR